MVLKLNFCSDFDHKVGQDFEVEIQARFLSRSLVEVTKLNLGQYSEARFGQDFNFGFSQDF